MLEILKYTIPALVVLLAAWLVLYKLLQNEELRRQYEIKKDSQKTIAPIRLRGYERLALLLERITPEHLLLNTDITEMTCRQLHQYLLQTIRLEFDHNLSQQIYVSEDLWNDVVNAKEQMVQFVNTMSMQHPADAPAMDAAKQMLEAYNLNGETPQQQAIKTLKREVSTLYT